MKAEKEILKGQIRLSHTYRHLKINHLKRNLYLWFLILPMLIVYFFTYAQLSVFISNFVRNILSELIPVKEMTLTTSEFLPYFGDVTFITLPTAVFDSQLNILTLIVSAAILWFMLTGKRRGNPASIFVSIGLFIQIISCIFFIFAAKDFPYSATIYSELYIKQQISLWLFFFIIIGVVTVLLGNGYFYHNLFFILSLMAYSFIYGVLRYVAYLYIVSEISTIYMAALFFTFGPLFDFLYVTYFYGLYVNRIILVNESKDSEDIWQW